jgi:hypothetical protein
MCPFYRHALGSERGDNLSLHFRLGGPAGLVGGEAHIAARNKKYLIRAVGWGRYYLGDLISRHSLLPFAPIINQGRYFYNYLQMSKKAIIKINFTKILDKSIFW